MREPSDIILHLLTTSAELASLLSGVMTGLAVVPDGDDDPDDSMILFDTTARPDGRLMRTGERIEHPGIMIHFRGLDYHTVWTRANTVALFLDARIRESIVVDSDEIYTLHNVSRTPVVVVGIETVSERRRHLMTLNATLTLTQDT